MVLPWMLTYAAPILLTPGLGSKLPCPTHQRRQLPNLKGHGDPGKTRGIFLEIGANMAHPGETTEVALGLEAECSPLGSARHTFSA